MRARLPLDLRGRLMTIRVLLVDDQALVRAGFRMVLDAQPDIEVVGEAGDGAAAVALRRASCARRRADGRPDARLDGIEATRAIARAPAASRRAC